ncbi:MAG: C39 family peptidase, partial [Candidatus Sumerlaeota bacterium]
GLDAWVRRFRNWDQVKEQIAKGQPVIASIRFGVGEFPSNPLKSSGGHLIVIRGFAENGDVIVNDPAHKDVGNGIIYKADELARAWFEKGGVAYIIHQPGKGQ